MAVIALCGVSCSVESHVDSPNNVTPQRSYTIMLYGSGGGLDIADEQMINSLNKLKIPSNINVVGQFKWSLGYRSELSDGKGGVSRFKFNHSTLRNDFEPFASNDYRIDDSENLSEFISWARTEAPADEYLIIFIGHGNGYHPMYDAPTRGILRDDMYSTYLGIDAIREAFAAADIRFSLTMMMCCLVNTMEYVTELAPYTDYYYASNHVMVLTMLELEAIVEGLIKYGKQEDAVLSASKRMIDMIYDNPTEQLPYNEVLDATLTRTSSISELNKAIKRFVDRVSWFYDRQEWIGEEAMRESYGFDTSELDAAMADSYYLIGPYLAHSNSSVSEFQWYRNVYTYDIVDIVTRIAAKSCDSTLKSCAERVVSAATEAIAYQRSYRLSGVERVYYGVTLVNSDEWAKFGYDAARYDALAFDRATGWSRLLQLNQATYPHTR
ncbi:MAG: hypothetical protein J6U91_02395 [Alistipes sp.]|nr:hypothetical protein [Alistipes sp.]